MSGPPSKKAAMSGPPSKSGRRPRAAVGLAGADLAVLEDELRAGVDDGGPVGEDLLRPLAVGAGLVVEGAVGVHAAQGASWTGGGGAAGPRWAASRPAAGSGGRGRSWWRSHARASCRTSPSRPARARSRRPWTRRTAR